MSAQALPRAGQTIPITQTIRHAQGGVESEPRSPMSPRKGRVSSGTPAGKESLDRDASGAQGSVAPRGLRLERVTAAAASGWDPARVSGLERECFGVDAWTEVEAIMGAIGRSSALVAAYDATGVVMGYGATEPQTGEDAEAKLAYPYWYLWTLLVDPQTRGNGLGRRILAEICDLADEQEKTLVLHVREDNASARHLYATLGFMQQGSEEDFYHIDGDRSRTAVVYVRVPTPGVAQRTSAA